MNERHENFIAWANDPDANGWRYAIVWRRPCPGIGWVRVDRDGKVINESQGAFYDGADDHPEGAVEWARTGANAHRAKVAEWHREWDAMFPALFPKGTP